MDNTIPLVSFLVTTYNCEDCLELTLNSLLNQSYANTEIIVVDDGSNDGTSKVLRRFAHKHEKVHAFLVGRVGRAKALNYGLVRCKGKYIAINDADDLSMPIRIEKQVQFLQENQEYVLVGSKMFIHDTTSGERDQQYNDRRPEVDAGIRHAFLKGQPIQHSSVLMHARVAKQIGGYNESINFLLDRDMFLRLAEHGKLYNLDQPLISLGRSNQQYFRNTFNGKERILQDYKYRLKAARIFNASALQKINIQLHRIWNLIAIDIKFLLKNMK